MASGFSPFRRRFFSFSFLLRKGKRRKAVAGNRRLRFEPLEDRTLPSATVSLLGAAYSQQSTTFSFTTAVSGAALPESVPVSLYWSSGADFATSQRAELPAGTGPSYAWNTIPAGTQPGQYTQTVSASILVGAPAYAQYLLVVLGDPQSPGFDPSSDVWPMPLTLDVTPVSQGAGKSPNGVAWAGQSLGFSTTATIKQGGCLLTSLDMALNAAGVVTNPHDLDVELTDGLTLPGQSKPIYGYFPHTGFVNPGPATVIAENTAGVSGLTFHTPNFGSASQQQTVIPTFQTLRDLLTSTGAPLIVKVANPHTQAVETSSGSDVISGLNLTGLSVGEPVSDTVPGVIPAGTTIEGIDKAADEVYLSNDATSTELATTLAFFSTHFVLVTGLDGNGSFVINDPGNQANHSLTYFTAFNFTNPGAASQTLSDFRISIVGYVKDPPDESAMYVAQESTGDDVGLAVSDPTGDVTGVGAPGSAAQDQIPNSYFFDEGPVEGTGDPTTLQLVYVYQPSTENYAIASTGSGDYTLETGGESVGGQPTPVTTFTASASSLEANDVTAASTNGQITFAQETPEVNVTANGGVSIGSAFPATATITDASGNTGPSLEGVGLQVTYYSGTTVSGQGTTEAPSAPGTYTVVASFPGSADYTSASAQATFTISPQSTIVPLQQVLDTADTGLGGIGQSDFASGIISKVLGMNGNTLPMIEASLDSTLGITTDFIQPLQSALNEFQNAVSNQASAVWSSIASNLQGAGFTIPLPFTGTPDAKGNLLEVSWSQTASTSSIPLQTTGTTGFSYLDAGGGGLFGSINGSGQVTVTITFGIDVNKSNQLGFFILPNPGTITATLNGYTASNAISGTLAIGDLANVSVTAGLTLSVTGNLGLQATANDPDGKIRLADLTNNLGGVVTGGFSNSSLQLKAHFAAHLDGLPPIPWTGTFTAAINSNGSVTFTPSIQPPSPTAFLSSLGSSLFSLGDGIPVLGPLSNMLNQPLPLIDSSIAQLTGLDKYLPQLPSGSLLGLNLTGTYEDWEGTGGTLSLDITPQTLSAFVHGWNTLDGTPNGTPYNLVSWVASNEISLINENITIPIFSLGVPDIISAEIDATFGIHASLDYNIGFGLDGRGFWALAGGPSNPNLGLTFGVTAGIQGQVEVFGIPLAEAGGDIGFSVTPYVTLTPAPAGVDPQTQPNKVYMSDLVLFGSNPLTDLVDDLSVGIQGDFTGQVYASIDLFLFSLSWSWGISIPVFNYQRSPTWPTPGGVGPGQTPWQNVSDHGGVVTFTGTSVPDDLSVTEGAPVNGVYPITIYWPEADQVNPNYATSETFNSTSKLVFNGGSGDDTLTTGPGFNLPVLARGGSGNDTFNLQNDSGSDTLIAGSGSNLLEAGSGNDLILGGAGADTLVAGTGTDTIYGGSSKGTDTVLLGPGKDTFDGGSANYLIQGGAGTYQIDGGSGSDTITAGSGKYDTIYGGSGGHNQITGSSSGFSLIYGGGPHDTLIGGAGGHDTIYGSGGPVPGSLTDSVIRGGDLGNNLLFGGGGGDVISGISGQYLTGKQTSSGNNTLYAGSGNETLYGGDGQDLQVNVLGNGLVDSAGDGKSSAGNLLIGGSGNDVLFGDSTGSSTLQAGNGNDTLYAGSDTNSHTGDYLIAGTVVDGLGVDGLYGSVGNDYFQLPFGSSPNDTLVGGGGSDTLVIKAETGAGTSGPSLTANLIPNATTTTITVNNGAAIAALNSSGGVGAVIQIDSEKMLVTKLSGNTLTVTRGYDGTTAARHAADDVVGIVSSISSVTALGIATTTSTTVTVNNASAITAGTVIQIDGEQMLVTGGSGSTLTVTRGYNNTAASTHANNALVLLPSPGLYLTAAVPDATSTTIAVNNAAAVAAAGGAGTVIQIDGEQMLVSAVSSPNNSLTVTRGYNGTTATSHGLNGTVLLPLSTAVAPSGDNYTMDFTQGSTSAQYIATLYQGLPSGLTIDPATLTTLGQITVTLPSDIPNVELEAGPGDNWIQVDPSVTRNIFLYGGPGQNTLMAGSGDDTLAAGPGTAVLYGGAHDDVLYGGDAPEQDADPTTSDPNRTLTRVSRPEGNDTLIAGSGDTELFAGAGNDLLIGGSVARAVDANGTPGLAIPHGQYTYQLVDGAAQDALSGGSGNDLLIAGQGGPGAYLEAGTGNNILVADNDGFNTLVGGDAVKGSSATDLMLGGNISNTITAGQKDATLVGGAGLNTLVGGAGNDTLYAYSPSAWGPAITAAAAVGLDLVPPGLVQGDQVAHLLALEQTQPLTSQQLNELTTDLINLQTQLSNQDQALQAQYTPLEQLEPNLTPKQQQELVSLLTQDNAVLAERILVNVFLGAKGGQIDSLLGGSGNDVIYGSRNLACYLGGGSGNDTIYYFNGNDTVAGGAGQENQLVLQADGAIHLAADVTVSNAIDVTFSQQSGTTANNSNVVTGLSDTDLLSPGEEVFGPGIPSGTSIYSIPSNGTIDLSANTTLGGTNTLSFGWLVGDISYKDLNGNSYSVNNIQSISVQTGSANDTVTIDPSLATLPGGLSGLKIALGSGNDTINATSFTGNETLQCGSGNDVVQIGAVIGVNSSITAGGGIDELDIGGGNNSIKVAIIGSSIQVNGTPILTGNYEGFQRIVLIGGAGSNTFTCTNSTATLELEGGGGTNTFNVTGGSDTVVGGSGPNYYDLNGAGNYTIIGGTPTVTSAPPAASGVTPPAPGGMTQNTSSLSEGRSELVGATVGTKAIFAGGFISGPVVATTAQVDIYDASNGNWTSGSWLSVARAGLAAATVGPDAIFAGGQTSQGSGEVKTVDIYNVSTGWSSGAWLSQARAGLAATAVGTKAIFAGGSPVIGGKSNQVDIYDVSTGQWSSGAWLSQARFDLAATSVGTLALFAGGLGVGPGSGISNVVDIYNAVTGLWSSGAWLSQPRYGLAATSVGTKAFFAGGTADGFNSSSMVDVYDASTGQWATLTLPHVAGVNLAATSEGTKALFSDGTTVDIYDTSTDQWSTTTLSKPLGFDSAASSLGTYVLFAGGSRTTGTAVDVLTFPPAVLIPQPVSMAGGSASIPYTLIDGASNPCSIQVQYSVNGGPWQLATAGAGGDGTGNLTSSPTGTAHAFVWNTAHDLGDTNNPSVQVRITPSDSIGTGDTVSSGPFSVNNTGAINNLTVNWTDAGNDAVTLTQNGQTITVNGSVAGGSNNLVVIASNLTSLTVNGGAGDNKIDASAVQLPITLNGGSGGGPDTLIGGSGSDLFDLSGVGSTYQGGSAGDNTIAYAAGSGDIIALTASSLSPGLVDDDRANIIGSVAGIENFIVTGNPASVNNGSQLVWPFDDVPISNASLGLTVPNNSPAAVLSGSFTDTNPNASTAKDFVTINWGDGTTSPATLTDNGGTFTISARHTYFDGGNTVGSYSVIATIIDSLGTATTVGTTFTGGLVLTGGVLDNYSSTTAFTQVGSNVNSFAVSGPSSTVFYLSGNNLYAVTTNAAGVPTTGQVDAGVQAIAVGPDGALYDLHTGTGGNLYRAAQGTTGPTFDESGVESILADIGGDLYKLYSNGTLDVMAAGTITWTQIQINVQSISLTNNNATLNAPLTSGYDWQYSGSTGTLIGSPEFVFTLNGQPDSSSNPLTVTVGESIPVTLGVIDSGTGTIATGYTGTVTLTDSDAAAVAAGDGPPTQITLTAADAGVYPFPTNPVFLTALESGTNGTVTYGTQTLTATDASGLTATAPVIVAPAAASTFSIDPPPVVAGSPTTVTVTAYDSHGNIANGFNGQISLTSPNGQLTVQGSPTSPEPGIFTYNVTLGAAGGAKLVATSSQNGTVTGSGSVLVQPGAPSLSASTLSVAPAIAGTGSTVPVILTIRDANGNQQTTGDQTVVFYANGTSLGSGTDNGDGTYTLLFPAGGNLTTYSFTATINGSAVTSASPTLSVIPGPPSPSTSTLQVSSASIAAGQSTTVTFQAADQYGNLDRAGLAVSFGLAGGSGSGTFGPIAFSGNGTYSATFTGTTAGTNTITVSVGGQELSLPTLPGISVTPGAVSDASSTVAVSSRSIQVGGSETMTLTARDAFSNQESSGGLSVQFQSSSGGAFTNYADNGDGTYTATFTAGTATGRTTITATIGGQSVTSPAPTITITPGAVSLDKSSVTVSSPSIPAGSPVTVTLTARDALGNQENSGGLLALFQSSGGGVFTTYVDNGDGTYTATFTPTTTGTDTITGEVNGQPLTSSPANTQVTAGPPSPANSSIAAFPASITAGSTTAITLTLADAFGNPEPAGLPVQFSLGSGTSSGQFGPVTYQGNGVYTASFQDTTAGSHTITATINGQSVVASPATVTVTAGQTSLSASSILASSAALTAGTTTTLTLTAVDAYGNPEKGSLNIGFAPGAGSPGGSFGPLHNLGNGKYSETFTPTVSGTDTIIGEVNGQPLGSPPASVVVTAGLPSPLHSHITVSTASIPVGRTATITLTLADAFGNSETGDLAVGFTLRAGSAGGKFGPLQNLGGGTYSETFTPAAAGSDTISATLNGQALTSSPVTVTVPAGPTGTITTVTPMFTWPALPGAAHYVLTITDKTTKKVVLTLSSLTGPVRTLIAAQALTPGHSYTWTVQAVSSTGHTTTVASNVTFRIAPLPTPTLTGPSGSQTTTRPTFTWTSPSGLFTAPGTYTLEVLDEAPGQAPLLIKNLKRTSYTLTAAQALKRGHTYKWYVVAMSSNGQASVASRTVTIRIS